MLGKGQGIRSESCGALPTSHIGKRERLNAKSCETGWSQGVDATPLLSEKDVMRFAEGAADLMQ